MTLETFANHQPTLSAASSTKAVPVVRVPQRSFNTRSGQVAVGGTANTQGSQDVATNSTLVASRKSTRSLSKREQLMIVTQLSIMLRSGVDLADAVHSIHKRSTNPTIQDAMGLVYSALESGQSLSAALDKERHRFGGVMVASVSAGEASGRLPDVLARLSNILRDELRLQNALKSAVSYPIVLIVVTALVLAAMIFFVLPQFSSIYASSRAPTPAVTKILLSAASTIREHIVLVICLAVVLTAGLTFAVRSKWGRRQLDQAMLQLPMLRNVWRPLLTGRLFRLQGAMLQSGVPMLEVLQLTRETNCNTCFTELIDQVESTVMRGEGMAVSLISSPCMPEGAAEMIATAEANGQLGAVLETVGEFFESEGEQQLRDSVKIAEPAIIVVLGLVVGCIVLAVMLPLLDLSAASSHQ